VTRGVRLVAALVLALIAVVAVAEIRFQVVQAVQDRLATDFTIGDAQFSAPGLFVWPRLTENEAIASCDGCPSGPGTTAQYGVLRSDPGIAEFLTGYHEYALTAADVHLPQVVWIVQWPVSESCRDYPAVPHTLKCATYKLIDDATRWVIDAGQYLAP
jgi:hypothetical protein